MEKTLIVNVPTTKGRKAVRKLRAFGILATYDIATSTLTAFVTKYGEQSTRDRMVAALT